MKSNLRKNILFIFVLSFILSIDVNGQDGRQIPFNAAKLPKVGNKIPEYVPKGWKIEEQKEGDLNGDNIPDLVIKIQEDLKSKSEDEPVSKERIMIVLAKQADGKFKLLGVGEKVLQCTGCGGAFYGVVEAPADFEIKKGVIIVTQDSGSRNVLTQTYRFRYNAELDRIVLIGADLVDRDRATGETNSSSINYLTNIKITEQYKYSEKTDKDKLISSKKTTIKSQSISLENFNFEKIIGE
jgi:hypothetical protein